MQGPHRQYVVSLGFAPGLWAPPLPQREGASHLCRLGVSRARVQGRNTKCSFCPQDLGAHGVRVSTVLGCSHCRWGNSVPPVAGFAWPGHHLNEGTSQCSALIARVGTLSSGKPAAGKLHSIP